MIDRAAPDVIGAPERVERVLAAVVAMASELSLDGVLQRIVDSASELVDAQYGFLGVLDGRLGRRLGTFAVHGLDERHRDIIGRLPQGAGLLGEVIDHPEPLRIADVNAHPDRAGFPINHPQMASFLGVPIRIHDRVFGNLYLTNKRGGAFTEEDESIATAFAAAAGVAIENARLYEEGERQRRWLAATADVATSLLRSLSAEEALSLIVDRAVSVSACDGGCIVVPDAAGVLTVRAVQGMPGFAAGSRAASVFFDEVVAHGRSVVIPDLTAEAEARGVTLRVPEPVGLVQLHPLPAEAGTGVLALVWLREHDAPEWALDPATVGDYAQQAALVMQVLAAREAQARVAVLEDRDRIGRDLHDLVIQRLFAIGLSLESITRRVGEPARTRVSDAVDGLDQTIRDIRRTIFDLGGSAAPAELRHEVDAILSEAERLLGHRPRLSTRGPIASSVSDRVAEQLVAALRETMSNVVRHAGSTAVDVELSVGQDVRLVVSDDGVGLPAGAPIGNGLRNLRHRARGLGGDCTFAPARKQQPPGLRIEWVVPAVTP